MRIFVVRKMFWRGFFTFLARYQVRAVRFQLRAHSIHFIIVIIIIIAMITLTRMHSIARVCAFARAVLRSKRYPFVPA